MAGAAPGLRPTIKFWKVESGTVLYGTNQKGVCWINRKFPVGGSFFNHFKTLVQKDPPNGETEARTPSATAPNLPGLCIEIAKLRPRRAPRAFAAFRLATIYLPHCLLLKWVVVKYSGGPLPVAGGLHSTSERPKISILWSKNCLGVATI